MHSHWQTGVASLVVLFVLLSCRADREKIAGDGKLKGAKVAELSASSNEEPAAAQSVNVVPRAVYDLQGRRLLSKKLEVVELWAADDLVIMWTRAADGNQNLELYDGATRKLVRKVTLGKSQLTSLDVDPAARQAFVVRGGVLEVVSLGGAVKNNTYKPPTKPIDSLWAIPGQGLILRMADADARGELRVLRPGEPTVVVQGKVEGDFSFVTEDGHFLIAESPRVLQAISLHNGKTLSKKFEVAADEADDYEAPQVDGFVSGTHGLILRHAGATLLWDLDKDEMASTSATDIVLGPISTLEPSRDLGPESIGDGRFVIVSEHSLDTKPNFEETMSMRIGARMTSETTISLPWEPNSAALVVGGGEPRILVGSENRREALLLDSHGATVHSFSIPELTPEFDDDGDRYASGADVAVADDLYAVISYVNGPVVVYALETGKQLYRIEQHTGNIALAGGKLLIRINDKTLNCFVVASKADCGTLNDWWVETEDDWSTIDFSSDGDTIIVLDETARVYSLRSGQLLETLRHPRERRRPESATFDKAGNIIFIVDDSEDFSEDAVDALMSPKGKVLWEDTTRSGVLRRLGDRLFSGHILRADDGTALAEFANLDVRGLEVPPQEGWLDYVTLRDWRSADAQWLLSSVQALTTENTPHYALILSKAPLGALARANDGKSH